MKIHEEFIEEFTLLINPKVEHIGDFVIATTKEHFRAGDYALIELHELHNFFDTLTSVFHPKFDIDKKFHEYRIVIISGKFEKSNEILIRYIGQLNRIKIKPDILFKKIKSGDDKFISYDEESVKKMTSNIRKFDFTIMLGALLIETINFGGVISIIRIADPEKFALAETFIPKISYLETFFMTPTGHIIIFIIAAFFLYRYLQDIKLDERLRRDLLGLKYASESKT